MKARCATATFARRSLGFTLIELMIVIVIVGVLAGLAYPTFMESVRKSRRSDAFGSLTQIQQAQERWRSTNTTYATNLTAAPTATPAGLGLQNVSRSSYYDMSLDGVSATDYSAIATARSGTSQALDGMCVRLRIRVSGNDVFYGAAGSSGSYDESNAARCWSK